MSNITYYNLHDLIDVIIDYTCNIYLPQNVILKNDYNDSYNLYDILNEITQYVCEIELESNKCIMVSTPGNIYQILEAFKTYLCEIETKHCFDDLDKKTDLHSILNKLSEYVCYIPINYDCIQLGATSNLYSIMNRLNNYICFINLQNNCISQNETDSLHNIINDIIEYVCHIKLDVNCVSSVNPGSLHEILNAISHYICYIPLCDNCVINNNNDNLHNIINKILDYLCNIDFDNCMGIPEGSDLHTILQIITNYVCYITVGDSCIPGLNVVDEIQNILQKISDYLCEIPLICKSQDIDDTLTLYEALGLIEQIYCNYYRLPIIHYCIDMDGIFPSNNEESYSISRNDLIDITELIWGRSFTQDQRNNLNIKIFSEFKSFLVPSIGPVYNAEPKYTDIRAYIPMYPVPSAYNYDDFDYSPDTGDYSFTRYTFYWHENDNGDYYLLYGPIGTPTCDIYNKERGVDIDGWKSQYSQTIIRLYSQRTRFSCRVHVLVGHKTDNLNMECDGLDHNIETPNAQCTQITGSSSTFYLGKDTSGSTNTKDIMLNGQNRSREQTMDTIIDDYNIDTNLIYDISGSSIKKFTDLIVDVINNHGDEVTGNFLTILFLNDSQDGNDENVWWERIDSAMSGRSFKLNLYMLRILGTSASNTNRSVETINFFQDFGNQKPNYVNKYEVHTFSEYNTGDDTLFNDLINEAVSGGYECTCPDGSIITILNSEASSLEEAKILANSRCNSMENTSSNVETTLSGSNTLYRLVL